MLKKFPVTSANGNEYLASAKHCHTMVGTVLEVTLYKKKKRKFLWFEWERFTQVYWNQYSGDSFYKYVATVKDTVLEYEKKAQKEKDNRDRAIQAHEINLKKFEEWDGVCK